MSRHQISVVMNANFKCRELSCQEPVKLVKILAIKFRVFWLFKTGVHVCGYYGNRLEAGGGVDYVNETAGGDGGGDAFGSSNQNLNPSLGMFELGSN